MGDATETEIVYEAARAALYDLVDGMPLNLQALDRDALEARAARNGARSHSLERKCVNYLRHQASAYDDIRRKLSRPSELGLSGAERHVLYVEQRRLVARAKQRVLDEIARHYPWLGDECRRQAWLDGVEGNPGDFRLAFGPFKGRRLRDLHVEYLIRLLGQGFVQGSFRTRIERHLTERVAGTADGPGPCRSQTDPRTGDDNTVAAYVAGERDPPAESGCRGRQPKGGDNLKPAIVPF